MQAKDRAQQQLRQKVNTVEPLLADTPNSGHLPYNGQCAMYQLRFPYILYFKNLPIADTPNSGHLRIADSFSGTKALANTSLYRTL